MSKHSKPRDLWRHVFAAAHGRPADWCRSCGYYPVVNDGRHRDDCTAPRCACDARLIRPESIRAGRCYECRLWDAYRLPPDDKWQVLTDAFKAAIARADAAEALADVVPTGHEIHQQPTGDT